MTPPRLGAWLLRRIVPPGVEGDAIRGDILEEFALRAPAGRLRAAWEFWRAVLSLAFRYRRPTAAKRQLRSSQSMRDAVAFDLRSAVRTLVKAPGVTLVVVVTLALGIGANTAVFSALNAVILRPLPYPGADRLVRLVAFNPPQRITSSNVSAADLVDWRRDAPALEALAAFSTFSMTIRGRTPDAPAERIAAAQVSELFGTLGVGPAIGQDFKAEDRHPGPATAAIVSHGLWQRRFGGDASIVGRPLRPGGATTIVGVMPRGFSYPEEVDFWVPFTLDPAGDGRNNRYLESVGRLKPGASVAELQSQLDAISARLEAAYPVTNRGWRVRVVPLIEYVVGDARRTLLLLVGAVGLVMLVACANVANLLLAHAVGRQREIALRAAIGAGRGRIFRQVLTESLLLSLGAGAIGLLIGRWVLQVLVAVGASGIPRLEGASLDRTVLWFCLGISIATGLVFGLLPALHLSQSSLMQTLRDGARRGGARSGTRRALIVAEIAIALVLLASAGLLTRSFDGLRRIDVGFDPRNLVTMRVTLGGPRYREPAASAAYYAEAVRRISAVPGIRSAAAILSLPVGGGGFYLGRGFIRPGVSHPAEGYSTGFQIATPGYFRTMGMAIYEGRDFDEHDTAAGVPVAVVNRTFAERFFPGESPLGQKILVTPDEKVAREIIGVVGDLKSKELAAAAGAEMYVPLVQSPADSLTFVVRTESVPARSIAPIRAALQALDPAQAAYEVQTFDDVMRKALAEERFSMIVFAAFALLAVVLAAVGLYGVMSYVVSGRTREMGVRMALGARPVEVRRLVVRQALVLLGIGMVIGIPASIAATRLLGKLLYGVHPADPLTLLGVTAVIGAMTWLSTYLPARRATRVDPAVVLRGD